MLCESQKNTTEPRKTFRTSYENNEDKLITHYISTVSDLMEVNPL